MRISKSLRVVTMRLTFLKQKKYKKSFDFSTNHLKVFRRREKHRQNKILPTNFCFLEANSALSPKLIYSGRHAEKIVPFQDRKLTKF